MFSKLTLIVAVALVGQYVLAGKSAPGKRCQHGDARCCPPGVVLNPDGFIPTNAGCAGIPQTTQHEGEYFSICVPSDYKVLSTCFDK